MSDESTTCLVLIIGGALLFGMIYLIDAPYRKQRMAQSLTKPLEYSNQVSPPQAQSKSLTRGMHVSNALLLLITLPFLYISGSELAAWSLVQLACASIEATVYARESDVPSVLDEGGPTYYLAYQYETAGNTYLASQDASQRTYERLSEESRVRVRYLTFSPSTSLLAGNDTDSGYVWDHVLMFIFFGSCALVVGVRFLRRHD